MASQATRLESNHQGPEGMFGNAAEFVRDLVSLGELQFQLLLLDLREGSRHTMAPLAVLVLGACLALGCFPVLLVALGLGLAALGLSPWLAMLLAAVIGMAIAGGMLYGGVAMLRRQAKIIRRSKAEFDKNLRWVKMALTRKGRPRAEPHVGGF